MAEDILQGLTKLKVCTRIKVGTQAGRTSQANISKKGLAKDKVESSISTNKNQMQ